MLEKRISLTNSIVAVCTLAYLLSGCASMRIEYLSGQEFLIQAEQIDGLNSFHWTSYIGISHDRVYLEFGHPALIGEGTRRTVYWTRLSELSDDLVAQLKSRGPFIWPRKNILEVR